jgi:hypothetical protein
LVIYSMSMYFMLFGVRVTIISNEKEGVFTP